LEISKTIQNILFPVDFSASCIAIAPYVKRAAAICGARVTLVYVFDPDSHNGFELLVRPRDEIAEDHREIATQMLHSFLEDDFPSARCPRALLSGDAAAEIAGFARVGGFDLIVMPTHSGSFRRMLLGSTTAKVLNDVDCPVLTTMHALGLLPRPLDHREWLCAVGLDANSEGLLRYASRLASAVEARLSLIHVIPGGDASTPSRAGLQDGPGFARRREALQQIEDLQNRVGCQLPVRVASGRVKEALLEEVRRVDADIIVVGRDSQPASSGRMRDLTYTLVRDSTSPVVSV
jgi:nucleotide-binding universal stress UspA family protein